MKWIKASERPPEKGGMYVCHIMFFDGGMTFYPVGYVEYNKSEKAFVKASICGTDKGEVVDWLDESEDQETLSLRAENERLRGLLKQTFIYYQIEAPEEAWAKFETENNL